MNRTVLRTMEILEIVSERGEISLAGLVEIAGYPGTSMYDILHALEERAVAYRCTDKVCCGIEFRAYTTGRSYSKDSDLLNNSYQCMRALAEDIGKTVLLGRMDGEETLYIAKCEPKHPVVMAPSTGDEEPIKNTAFTKIAEVFTHHEKKMRQLSKEERDHIRAEKLASYGLDGLDSSYNIASPIYNLETRLSEVVDMFGVREVGVNYSEELKKAQECIGKISERLGFI